MQAMAPGVDVAKIMTGERENLELLTHQFSLANIESELVLT